MTKYDIATQLEFTPGVESKGTLAGSIVMNTLITVVLYSLFVAGFYFVVAARVEKRVVTSNVNRVLDGLTRDVSAALDKDDLDALSTAIDSVRAPDMSDADREVRDKNRRLTKRTFIVLGSIAAGALVAVMLVWGLMRLHAKRAKSNAVAGNDYPDGVRIIIMVLIAFAAVVVTEFVFLYAIGARYWALDENRVKETVVSTLVKYGESANTAGA